jgi:pimeloyl-ACP methyl ester carboxylesterase
LKHLAEDIAKAGFIALRFDLDGTGDSAGSDADPDRIHAWLASIHDACDFARSAGATQLVLAGVRLGATLAMLAATSRSDIAGLIAINAVASGRAFLREGRALQSAMDLESDPANAPSSGSELIGFEITEETSATLLSIDISQVTICPAQSLLLIERDDMPARNKLAEHLRALGADLALLRLPGYVDMMRDPMSNTVAHLIIDASVDYVRRIPLHGYQDMPGNGPAGLRAVAEIKTAGTQVVEEAVTTKDGMFAIVSRPRIGAAAQGTVLLLTVGALLHVGPNRMYVPLARQLAGNGYTVLRVDLSGIGESNTRSGAEENVVYGPHAIDDVVRWVVTARQNGAGRIAAVGMCSGSYHALQAAIRGCAIDSLLLINPAVLRYAENIPVFAADAPTLSRVKHYNKTVRDLNAWKKLLRGSVSFAAILQVVSWHAGKLLRLVGKEMARWLHLSSSDDLGRMLQSMARRNMQIDFFFSTSEPGRKLLAIEAGSVVSRLRKAGKLGMHLFAGPDHTFTQRWAQRRLHAALMKVLVKPNQGESDVPSNEAIRQFGA